MSTKHGWPLKIGTFRLSPIVEAPIGPHDFVTKPMDRWEALYASSTHAPYVPASAGFTPQYTIYIYNDGDWMVQWEADAEPDYPEQFATKAEAIKYARKLVSTKSKANPRRRKNSGGYTVAIPLSVYNVYQEYWEGQGDPLYAVLSRRPVARSGRPDPGIPKMEVSEREMDRLEEVSLTIMRESSDPMHYRVAETMMMRHLLDAKFPD